VQNRYVASESVTLTPCEAVPPVYCEGNYKAVTPCILWR